MATKKDPSAMFIDSAPEEQEAKVDPDSMLAKKNQKTPEPVDDYVEQDVGNIIDLPSQGKLGYPGSISHREVMAGDEEILKTATPKNFVRTLNRVLKSICNDADFYDELSIHDRDYILCYIWANTYSPEKVFEAQCRHCGHKEDEEVDMLELDVENVKENLKTRFPVPIKKTGETIQLRLATVRDENNAEKFMADAKDRDTIDLSTVLMVCAAEFGRPMSTQQRMDYLKSNISAKEKRIMKQYHEYFTFGLQTEIDHVCSECQGVTQAHVPFHVQDIIAPDVRSDFDQLLRDI